MLSTSGEVVKEYDSREEEIYALVMDNANQRERTPPQKWREGRAIYPIIKKRKEDNSLSNLMEGNEKPDQENFPDRANQQTRDIVAETVGVGTGRNYSKLNKVMEAAQNGDEVAQEQVVELEKDQSIHGAYTTVRDAHKPICDVRTQMRRW